MGRHRQPLELARLKGADRKNPQRYATDIPVSEFPLGDAPDHLDVDTKAAWFELSSYALKGVLTGADRFILEIAASLLAQFRADPVGMPSARIGHLVNCASRLGLSPVDRQKLGLAKPAEKNPFDEF